MKTIIAISLMVVACHAAPSTYFIKKLPSGSIPAVDGYIHEWPEAYFIDSIRSDDNVFWRDGGPWTRENFQIIVYGGYDSGKVYFAAKVIADNNYVIGNGWNSDNMKINPGGQAMAFYINSDETSPTLNPSSPFALGSTLWAGSKTNGNGNLPTYEFAASRHVYDPFEYGTFMSFIGTEEMDLGNQMTCVAIGLEYKGNKQDWNSSAWDNPLCYPTFELSSEKGPEIIAVERRQDNNSPSAKVDVNPNPFNPRTTIRFNIPAAVSGQSVSLSVYDLQGRLVRILADGRIAPGNHAVSFDGRNDRGEVLGGGTYLCRMTESGRTSVKAMVLLK